MMFRRDLIKNKMYGMLFVLIGIISVWACGDDATAALVLVPMGIMMFLDRRDIWDESRYYEEEDEYE